MGEKRNIRAVTHQDMDTLVALKKVYRQEVYKGFASLDYIQNMPIEPWREAIESRLDSGEFKAKLMEIDGIPQAFALYHQSTDEEGRPCGEILEFATPATLPAAHMEALMTHVVADLLGGGSPCVSIWIMRDNLRARFHYEQFGFRDEGITKETSAHDLSIRWKRYTYRSGVRE